MTDVAADIIVCTDAVRPNIALLYPIASILASIRCNLKELSPAFLWSLITKTSRDTGGVHHCAREKPKSRISVTGLERCSTRGLTFPRLLRICPRPLSQ